MSDLPGVTVVMVFSPEDEGDDGPFNRTLYTLERQKYDGPLDIHLVKNVEKAPTTVLYRWGVQSAKTELVAMVEPGQEWPDDMVARLVTGVQKDGWGHGVSTPGAHAMIFYRSYYLDGLAQ